MERKNRSLRGRTPCLWTSGRPTGSSSYSAAARAVRSGQCRSAAIASRACLPTRRIPWTKFTSRPTGGGWRTTATSRAARRYTSRNSRSSQRSARSRALAAYSRNGAVMGWSCSTWACDRTMMGVRVTAGAEFVGSPPSALFTTRLAPNPGRPQYAVTRDGQRFLGLERVEEERNTMTFLLNWLNTKSPDDRTPTR